MKIVFALFLSFLSLKSLALEIEAKMLASGSALLQIDGKQRMLREGARSPEGVLLVSADGKKAVIEYEGKRQNLQLSRSISTQFKAAEMKEFRIASSQGGHYETKGLVNGMPVDFMVDTGATFISLGEEQAERLGIDYRAGNVVPMSTANGVVNAYQVVLPSVSVGNIVVNQVVAVVHPGPFATKALLGNSYLSKVDIKIDQGVLVLKEKLH